MTSLFRTVPVLLLTWGCLFCYAEQAQAGVTVGFDPAKAGKLSAAANACGIELAPGSVAQIDATTRLAVIEARAGAALSADDAQRLGSWVQHGGALLLTLSRTPGNTAFQLGFLSPTTGWHTEMANASRGSCYGAITAAEADPELFPSGTPGGLNLPFHFQLRPWHAVERGEGRYENFDRTIAYIALPQKAGDHFWTRPLLNRDWHIRLRGNDGAQTPLLLTGRYGAGRVAVFASSAEEINASAGAPGLWAPVVKWLVQDRRVSVASPLAQVRMTPDVTVDKPSRAVRVTLRNPAQNPARVQVLLRLLTWERAIMGDISKDAVVPAGGVATVAFTIPAPGATQYQALDFRDAYQARLGVLSADGSTLLHETSLPVDLRPDVLLNVATDNLRTLAYPFAAPGYGGQDRSFVNRTGMPVMAYAYPPNQKVNVTVTVANGVRNIAPLARATDETQPSNPSAMALNDDAAHYDQLPLDGITAYGMWSGTAGQGNTLAFTFSSPVNVSGVTLYGSPDDFRKRLQTNPGAAIIELDGRQVAKADDLDKRFVSENGLVVLRFAPAEAKVVRVRLPWLDQMQGRKRQAPRLGEVGIEGATGALKGTVTGTLTVALRDVLTGTSIPVATRELSVAAESVEHLQYAVDLPKGDDGVHLYRVDASFAGQSAGAPLMQIQPEHPLQPVTNVRPGSAPHLNFLVTHGFCSVFDIGTGTREPFSNWGQPDDLVWAYAHNLKQVSANARTEVARLYVSASNMAHYCSPWGSFLNGEPFFTVATPLIVEHAKKDPRWKSSDAVMLGFGDRWDSGPAVDQLNTWQDYIGFDDYLRANGLPGLQEKTRAGLANEIHQQHETQWQEWNLERYAESIRVLHDGFQKEGKNVTIEGQGLPFVPSRYEGVLAQVIRGQSDDSTWGMEEESLPYTTGRQMALKAFNPGWQLTTLFNWGWDSAVLGNTHWHTPVGTTEPSRRHIYDRAFRGVISENGQYQSIHTFGYAMNGGVSYTMNLNDWQESWRAQERHSLLTPDGPIGIGLVVGSARFNDPAHVIFTGGGMGDNGNAANKLIGKVANVVRDFQDTGLPLSFAANIGAVEKWNGTAPLIVWNLDSMSDGEVEALRKMSERGMRMAAFFGSDKLSEAAARLFGVGTDGSPAGGRKVGDLKGRPIVAGKGTLLIPLAAEALTADSARTLDPLLRTALQPPLQLPAGTAGYGFTSNHRRFIVVEDQREEGRVVTVRLRAGAHAATAHAADVNDHRPLAVRREGADWLIDLPLRPGDGNLVCVDEMSLQPSKNGETK